MSQLLIALQVAIGLGLLNVWLLRSRRSTGFRGAQARDLKDEFAAYGLPTSVFYLVGALKIGSAVALLAGVWVPVLVWPAAAIVTGLMVGALVMHMKVRDPLVKSAPALLMLIMSATVLAVSIG